MAKAHKYRTDGRDTMPLADVSAAGTTEGAPANAIAPNKIGVYHQGQHVGTMGLKAGEPTARRFLPPGHGAKLGKVDGRPAWVSTAPTSGRGSEAAGRVSSLPLRKSLKAAKGSNK